MNISTLDSLSLEEPKCSGGASDVAEKPERVTKVRNGQTSGIQNQEHVAHRPGSDPQRVRSTARLTFGALLHSLLTCKVRGTGTPQEWLPESTTVKCLEFLK